MIVFMAVVAACTEKQADGPDAPSARAFKISARADAGTDSNELINSWFIAFADATGKVCRTLERPAGGAPVEMDIFSTNLEPGTYMAYSFANITPAELGLDLSEGQTVPQEIESMAWSADVHNWTSANLIPMSGMQTVNVTSQVTQPFAIEVVRMVARMELEFSNSSDHEITLHQMWMLPMGSGNINLFPDYSRPENAPALRTDADTATICRTLASTLPPASNRSASHRFYTLESDAARFHATGHYALHLDITHRSGDNNLAVRDTITMLTPELTYINRNDHILLPVRLADYVVKMDVRFYPPIGGYPAVVNEMKGSDYYIRFGTQGVFAITPLVREGSANAPWMQPSQLNIDIVEIAGDNIFNQAPAYDPLTGEITGELGNSNGTARVTLAVGAKDSQLSYTRTVYIIREDKK